MTWEKHIIFVNGRLEDSNGGNNSEIPNCQAAKMVAQYP